MLIKLPVALTALLTAALSSPTVCQRSQTQTYDEALFIASLPDGKVHSDFLFTMKEEPWTDEPSEIGPNIRGEWTIRKPFTQFPVSSFHTIQLLCPLRRYDNIAQHYNLLPPELSRIIQRLRIGSFQLTLSSGRWLSTWPIQSRSSANTYPSTPASGIELFAWLETIHGESDIDERRRWEDFTGSLGGLFCAGIMSTGTASLSSPSWGYGPIGDTNSEVERHRLYRISLPRLSATCTESLTPFLALLPCSSHAGLSGLLNPHKLFDGDWTMLSVQFFRSEGKGVFEFEVGSVLDPVRASRLAGGLGSRNFAIEDLYGRKLSRACPVATSSMIHLSIPENSPNPFTILPKSFTEESIIHKLPITNRSNVHGKTWAAAGPVTYAIWDCQRFLRQNRSPESVKEKDENTLNVRMDFIGEFPFRYPLVSSIPTAPLVTRRLLGGYGQERGKLGVEVINNLDECVEVVWVETWPWWVRGFIGSLKFVSQPNQPSNLDSSNLPHLTHEAGGPENVGDIVDISYTPPIARQRPTTIQALLRIPALSTARVLLDYESSYLWYTEYPSDAHRGFELPGALVTMIDSPDALGGATFTDASRKRCDLKNMPRERRKEIFRTHTTSILLSLPTPDFSMPYNVIILTSTIIALFFGSIMNALVRNWYVVDLKKGKENGGINSEQEKEHST